MPFSRRMSPLPLNQIRVTDPFWSRWQRVVAEKSLPAQFEELENTDRFGNLRRAAGNGSGPQTGFFFNDSDVYKWLEAAAYSFANYPSEVLREQIDTAIQVVLEAQEESGYVNSFIQLNHPDMKLRNLGAVHEMYCAGHLIEAGVGLFECMGDRRILDAGIKFADYLRSIFGPDKRRGYPGHEEIELALVRLAKTTGKSEYRDFARYLVEERGRRPTVFEGELQDPAAQALLPGHKNMVSAGGVYDGEYSQDHAPIREHDKVVGHAVRAMYLYTAAAELAQDRSDEPLEHALIASWDNLTRRRMYITGGVGPCSSNEGFSTDFDLPNLSAYAETCAACGLIFWGQSMLESTGSSQYADIVERALYNGLISGISLDGTKYFYDNPLESRGRHARSSWFPCACCPPNVARLIGNLGTYLVGIGTESVYIHQFAGFVADFSIGGVKVKLEVESEFPWKGDLRIRVIPESPVEFDLRVRIPDWVDDASTDLPGGDEAEYEDGYAVFRKLWAKGDILTMEFEMIPTWIEANPKVRDDLGRVALTRGPLVYCAESVENGFSPQLFSADVEAEMEEEWTDRLGGVMVVRASGYRFKEDDSDELYVPYGTSEELETGLELVPYYTWANRGPSDMQVWLRA
jgi:DUF1680 family protein